MTLHEFFKEHKSIAIAFSGGVDSVYLLYAAKKYCTDVTAYYFKTAFQPAVEYYGAKSLSDELGVRMKTIKYDILSDEAISNNHNNRCYYCKKTMFEHLIKTAREDGYKVVADGTNASDDCRDRPGMRALSELGIRSPLRECGFTKDDIRRLSKEAGLRTWDKPAYACLATRILTGEKITNELLNKVEKAETELYVMGFSDFRVRAKGDSAKLQIKEDQFIKAASMRKEILSYMKMHFDNVLLDMEVR